MTFPAQRTSHPSAKPAGSHPRVVRIIERVGVWAALLAMVAMAIMPTISHAIIRFYAPSGPEMVMEVCTARGVERISMDAGLAVADDSVDPDSKTLPASHDLNAEHCPMCGQTGHSGMAPPSQSLLKLPGLSDAPPRLFLQSPRPLFAWLQAKPRGPPLIS